MRETKDQTIARLKREVAELKEELKSQKQMTKQKLKESKVTLAKSQSKCKADYREQIKQSKSEYNKLKENYERLRDKFYTLMVRNSRGLQQALFSIEIAIGLDKEWLQQIREDNRKRLEAYHNGDLCDPYGNLFFFDNNLILTTNPKTGERLTLSQLTEIYYLLRAKSEYLSTIKEVAQFKKHDNGIEYLKLVNLKGRELFEKYYSHLY